MGISLSPLECGEIVFKFLFLFSIGLFCISSMTEAAAPRGGKRRGQVAKGPTPRRPPSKGGEERRQLILYYCNTILMECDVKSMLCSGYYVTPERLCACHEEVYF